MQRRRLMNKKTASFKENIRYTFIAYSLVPAFIVSCLGVLIFSFVWRYTIVQYNREQNKEISQILMHITDSYYDMTVEVANILEQEETLPFSDAVKAKLYEKAYQVGRESQCQGNLYILNERQQILFSFDERIPTFLVNPEYAHWGILRSLYDEQEKVVIRLQESVLCIGKAIENKGYVVVTIPKEKLKELFGVQSQQFVITDESGWICLENGVIMKDNLGRLDIRVRRKNGFVQYKDTNFYFTSTPLTGRGLWVYTITDVETQSRILTLIIAVILVVFIAIGSIAYFSTGKMAVKYTHDIDEIAKAFEKVQKGELDITLQIGSSAEFCSIAKDFNIMLDSLKKQIAQNQELAEHVAFAQVKQLESQFNPHFLFNTLDNIRFMTKIDIAAADKMIVSLSRLLRYSIRDAREELTVREDLDNLQSYLNILQIRFNKRFSYEIDIADEIMECLIPKLLIQPLLENAVKYGFAGRDTLHVIIKGYQEKNRIIFVCQDNGAGIEKDLLWEIRNQLTMEKNTSTHLGLYNIHRRIQLIYKSDYGMKIDSKEKEGVTVQLMLPYKKEKHEEGGL